MTISLSGDSPFAADLELASQLADAADLVSIDRFKALDLKVQTKADMTLVSDADKACESAIRELLRQKRPEDSVLGEEEGFEQGKGDRKWVIDPIDGTHNYVRGVPVWATLIALIEDDEVVLGYVSAPALGRRWWATKGGGSYTAAAFDHFAPRPIRVSDVASLSDAFLSYSSLDEWSEVGKEAQFGELAESVWRTRGFGDFWSYMMVAEGVVDVAAEPTLALYDMAALAPIVTEAGGTFTSTQGDHGPWGPGAVATNGRLHDRVLKVLA